MSALRQPTPGPLFTHARRIQNATLFLPGLPSIDPIEHPTWDALKANLTELAGGRPLTFSPGRAAYPDFDDFFAISVYAAGEPICMIADRWHDGTDMVHALADLRRLG